MFILLVGGAIILLGVLLSASTSLDVAGPLRSWFWNRDARRMQRLGQLPATLERAYWSRREYDGDAKRLGGLGYRVTSEEAVDPYITLPSYLAFGRTSGRQRRRRVPCIYAHYAYAGERTASGVG
jgi:hypothetical protein